jgi:predicted kinase
MEIKKVLAKALKQCQERKKQEYRYRAGTIIGNLTQNERIAKYIYIYCLKRFV